MVVESIPKMVGMAYAIVGFFILVYLFYKDEFNKKIGYLFLIISTVFGFLVFAPMFPNQFQLLVLRDITQLGAPMLIVIIGLLLFIILTFIFGRVFCGYLCPIGAIQELVHYIPIKKLKITNKTPPIVFRLGFLLLFILLAVTFSAGILTYFGFQDFFYMNTMSLFFYIFLALLIISIFVYRPFCRFFCPYGTLLSLTSIKSVFKLRRNDNCIDCKKCEKNCPTNEAGITDLKQECYLCNRCKDICPVDAIEYKKKVNKKEIKE